MMNFLRNHCHRVNSQKNYIVVSILMTMLSIVFAVYLTSKVEVKGSIAVVTESDTVTFKSDYIKFTPMRKAPSTDQLVLGKYDGVIIDKGNGQYTFDTIKGEDYKKMLQSIIKNPKGFVPETKETRGIGTNIVGYLLMFLLIQCVLFMFTLAEDMELKQIERIAAAPVSFLKYLLSHFIFNFLVVFIPAFFILSVMKIILGFNIGFSLMQYVGLLSLICFLGITFAMLINSVIKTSDAANMFGATIIVLTTVLSGSFYSFEKGNKILEKLLWILPQKNILSFVEGLEKGKALLAFTPHLVYIIGISLIFFIFALNKIKNDYVTRKD